MGKVVDNECFSFLLSYFFHLSKNFTYFSSVEFAPITLLNHSGKEEHTEWIRVQRPDQEQSVHTYIQYFALEVKRQKKIGGNCRYAIFTHLYKPCKTVKYISARCKKLGSGSHARLCYMLHHEGGGGVQRCTTFAGVLLLRGVNCFRCDGFLYML